MASVHPFRALRPAPERAAAVSSVPYDVVSTDEARQIAAGNPLSFLHVTRPEIDLPPGTDPYSDPVYEKARQNFTALRTRAPLVVEDAPSIYLYRLRMGAHEQTGVAACFSLDEYDNDVIKKHERTRKDKEDDRTRHMIELRAQTGVVFLTYRAWSAIDTIAARVAASRPLFDFTAEDGIHHTVWRAGAEQAKGLLDAFTSVPGLYIADGHHRAASAARARTELARTAHLRPGDRSDADTFIAVAFPHNQVQILAYNRIVKDLAGRSPEQFLTDLGERFPVPPGTPVPARKGHVSMYLAGRWYTIDLTEARQLTASYADALDVSLLQEQVLAPFLKIGDIRTDKRIDFVGGGRGTAALEEAVNAGRAAVAFSLFPVTIDDLLTIADEGGIMPPKSTWFEPKLRDGLLIHEI